MFSMLTLCIKHIPNINQDYGIDTDLVSIPRYYILVSYQSQNYGIEPSLDGGYLDMKVRVFQIQRHDPVPWA